MVRAWLAAAFASRAAGARDRCLWALPQSLIDGLLKRQRFLAHWRPISPSRTGEKGSEIDKRRELIGSDVLGWCFHRNKVTKRPIRYKTRQVYLFRLKSG